MKAILAAAFMSVFVVIPCHAQEENDPQERIQSPILAWRKQGIDCLLDNRGEAMELRFNKEFRGALGYSPPLNEKGFTVFVVRHGSSPRYPMSAIVSDVRRAVRFIRQHAGECVSTPTALACWAAAPAGNSRCCSVRRPTPGIRQHPTRCSGNPVASRRSSAYLPPTDLSRWGNRRAFPATSASTEADARVPSIRFVSPGAAPSLIVHGDADTTVPMVEGETMHAALAKAGVPASFIKIEGAGHGFSGADFDRANAAMVQWFERHLGSAAK